MRKEEEMPAADSADMQRRALAKLSSLRANVSKLGGLVEETYVREFHASLDSLENLGIDFSDFRIPDSELNPRVLSTSYRGGGAVHSYSREKYVQEAFLLTKLDAVIDYTRYALTPVADSVTDTLAILERIFSTFHLVARQLRNRYDSRPTLEVSDEYDVQDLLHALLKLFFKDIRPEEWTPSYAGSASRMDFLLKEEKVVIEVKKTRDTLRDKQIGDQLLLDIAHYKEHPGCKTLVCFIYDPEAIIGNPRGLEKDLTSSSADDLDVRIFIFP